MNKDYIWLSHELTTNTPSYGGGSTFEVIDDKQIKCGDSCNTVFLKFPNHIGSHVDAPSHFVEDGMSIEQYAPDDWIFTQPVLVDIGIGDGDVVSVEHMEEATRNANTDADIILVRTGAESYREQEKYWKSGPGFSPEIYSYLERRFASFTAIGMDAISISSLNHRELGREAHRVFLGAGIRIFEDLKLSSIDEPSKLFNVIALPLRYNLGDGAPVTMIASLSV